MSRHAATLETLALVRAILAQEGAMTLRQLYYALIARGHIVKDSDGSHRAYQRLSRILTDARERGDIAWDLIVDNVRTVLGAERFSGPDAAIRAWADAYSRDLMAQQAVVIQVWAESDSIGSVLARTADRYGIPVFVGRGFGSAGYVMAAARDIAAAVREGREVAILQFGDHDPSGEGIFRDVRRRLLTYARAVYLEAGSGTTVTVRHVEDWSDPAWVARLGRRLHTEVVPWDTTDEWARTHGISIVRAALTEAQIAEHGLQVLSITATKDSRLRSFSGWGTVEIEALPKRALLGLLTDAIESRIDTRALEVARVAEESERAIFRRLAESRGFRDTFRKAAPPP